ncbi:MAG: response regulator [Nitrospirae bacterium]|nr:response regulator [Nitrospirota bacterium]
MEKERILIVDDDAILAMGLQRLLQGWGYELAGMVYSGEEAVIKARQVRPDLILMDINLGGKLDGVETAQHIKTDLNIPVIYLTAYLDEEIIARVEKTNPIGYILKPFQESELYAAIKIALYNSKAERVLKLHYHIQNVLNTIVRISLEPISLTEQMGRVLDTIITIPWLEFESKGAIFLLGAKRDVLEMRVQRGLSEDLLSLCRHVPFGRCLCGMSAATGEIVFADSVDDRHDIRFDGMMPHGHFCVPIIFTNKLLGVLNLYLKDGHVRSPMEEEFLMAVSNTLAGIIARRGAEEELERVKRQNELILNSAGEGIYGLDRNGQITFVNPAAAKMLGWQLEELLGEPYHCIKYGPGEVDRPDEDCFIYRAFKEGNVYRVEDEMFWRKDATSFPVEYVATPIVNEHGSLSGAVVVFNDMLERKKAQAEKMAALGQLVSGVAHEINTPIGNAVLSASHLQEKTQDIIISFQSNSLTKSSMQRYLEVVKEDGDIILRNLLRSADMIKSFKMVSGDQTSQQRRRFDLRAYIADIMLGLKPMIKKTSHHITITCEQEIELDSYPGAFAQVITNLVMNAITHAFEKDDSGNIDITAVQKQNNVTVTVADNGKGIPEAILGKIFDPFFTTNRKAGNTGLGLHIVYNIVHQTLRGDIHCQSTETLGTSFTISMPRELPCQ